VQNLQDCRAKPTSVDDCAEGNTEELADIGAYQIWLQENAVKAPFATFVILHNLVTDSIHKKKTSKWLRNNFFSEPQDPVVEPRFACVKDAAAAAAVFLRLPTGSSFVPQTPSPSKALPGIGKHRIIDCSGK
jgi:hypothetical protein